MISRRVLRIKVMQILYAYFIKGDQTIDKSEKELMHSIEKTYDLYHNLLYLITAIADYALMKIEQAKNKLFPTQEDLNPNLKFVNNKVIDQISKHKALNKYLQTRKLNWYNYPEFIKKLYNEIKSSDYFIKYMNNPEISYNEDKKLIIDIYTYNIANNDDLYFILEEESIYWNDEVEFIISMIIKTIKKFKENNDEQNELLPLFKNEDDQLFVKNLFRKSIIKKNDAAELVKKFLKNWELERIAFIDNILLEMAIIEALEFKDIPIKVTINEYIDIAKYYSTEKSNVFINGILDKIFLYLKENNQLVKEGKGLIE